jgi:hypothetical protein
VRPEGRFYSLFSAVIYGHKFRSCFYLH